MASIDAGRIQYTPDNMVSNAREILDSSPAYQNDRVFLQVMAFSRDVRRNLESIREPHTRHFPHRGIGLLWGKRIHPGADTALLRTLRHRGGLGLVLLDFAPRSN